MSDSIDGQVPARNFHENDLFHTSIGFDMRAPAFGAPAPELYATAMEMIAYADANGIDKVDFQEHHCSDDGYLPTPFLMGTAAAMRSKRIAIVLGAVLMPLHDPVKLAEMIAVADLVSGGRIYTILAAGYALHEFDAFGVSIHERGRLMDEGFEIILRALSGERFRFGTREIFVRPLPARPVREIVYGGGGAPPAARRAARFGLGMWPMNDSIIAVYEEECRKLARAPGKLIRGYTSVYVCDDPERGWREVGPHVLHVVRSYAAWSSSREVSASPMHGMDTLEDVRKSGMIQVVTPEQAVELGKSGPIGVTPLIGGLKPEIGWRGLQLFVDKVLPRIKGAMGNRVPASLRGSNELA